MKKSLCECEFLRIYALDKNKEFWHVKSKEV